MSSLNWSAGPGLVDRKPKGVQAKDRISNSSSLFAGRTPGQMVPLPEETSRGNLALSSPKISDNERQKGILSSFSSLSQALIPLSLEEDRKEKQLYSKFIFNCKPLSVSWRDWQRRGGLAGREEGRKQPGTVSAH